MKKAEMEKKLKAYEDFVNTLERITSAQFSDVKKLVSDGILPGDIADYSVESFYPRCVGIISGNISGLRDRLKDIEKWG